MSNSSGPFSVPPLVAGSGAWSGYQWQATCAALPRAHQRNRHALHRGRWNAESSGGHRLCLPRRSGGWTMIPPPYRVLLDPLPVWDYCPWLLIPLSIGVSIVYKSVKCKSMSTVPREAAEIALVILFGMAGAAAVL